MTTLRLSMAGHLDLKQVTAALRALIATQGQPARLLAGRTAVCTEVWATSQGINHRVTMPGRSNATSALSSMIPGIRIEHDHRPTEILKGSPFGLQIQGPTDGMLRTDISEPTATTLLAALTGLRRGEVVVLQWLLSPLRRTSTVLGHSAELDKQERAKRSETEIVACGRVGVWSANPSRSAALAFQVGRVLHIASGPDGSLRLRRSRRGPAAISAMRLPSLIWPSHLNLAELTPLLGWPSQPVPIPGMVRSAARLLPLPNGAPTDGPQVGVSTFPGSSLPIRLGREGRLRHAHVIGPTGVGKTTLLTHLISQDIASGYGVVVFDPLGDLANRVAEQVPSHRLDDLTIVDPTDSDLPVGLNILAGTDGHQTADFVVGVMARLFASSWGPRTADVLRASVLTLSHTPSTTLADIPDLLTNPSVRRRLLPRAMDDRVLAGFWSWYDGLSDAERSSVIAPVLNKIRSVALRPEAVRTLCHPDGQLDFSDVFTKRRIIVVRLAKGLIGQDAASLIGGLLLARLWQATLARAAVSADERRRVFVYLDEFQDYLRLPIGVGDMLSQARGLGVGVTVAHQHLAQLPETVRRDVLANVGSRVIFQTTAEDSRVLARDLEPYLNPADLQGLASREVAMRIATKDRILPPTTGRTLPPPEPLSELAEARSRSQQLFGRPIDATSNEVEVRPVGRVLRGENET